MCNQIHTQSCVCFWIYSNLFKINYIFFLIVWTSDKLSMYAQLYVGDLNLLSGSYEGPASALSKGQLCPLFEHSFRRQVMYSPLDTTWWQINILIEYNSTDLAKKKRALWTHLTKLVPNKFCHTGEFKHFLLQNESVWCQQILNFRNYNSTYTYELFICKN